MFWSFIGSELWSNGRAAVLSDDPREALWLVDAMRTASIDEARTLPPSEAIRRLENAIVDLPRGIRNALQMRHLLLVVEPVHLALDPPSAIDRIPLRELSSEAEPPEEPQRHEIEVLVVNEIGDPVPDLEYELTLPGGEVRTGRTNAEGLLRYTDLDRGGSCSLTFPALAEQSQAAA